MCINVWGSVCVCICSAQCKIAGVSAWVSKCVFVHVCTILTLDVSGDTLIHFFCCLFSLFPFLFQQFTSLFPPRLKPMRATVHSKKRPEPHHPLSQPTHTHTSTPSCHIGIFSPFSPPLAPLSIIHCYSSLPLTL